jgi:hypothetical protein
MIILILLGMDGLPVAVFAIQQDLCAVHEVLRHPLDLPTDITDHAVGFQIAFHNPSSVTREGEGC